MHFNVKAVLQWWSVEVNLTHTIQTLEYHLSRWLPYLLFPWYFQRHPRFLPPHLLKQVSPEGLLTWTVSSCSKRRGSNCPSGFYRSHRVCSESAARHSFYFGKVGCSFSPFPLIKPQNIFLALLAELSAVLKQRDAFLSFPCSSYFRLILMLDFF